MSCVAVLVLMALIIFVAQNSGAVEVSLLTLHGRFSLAVALLAAAAAGCVLALDPWHHAHPPVATRRTPAPPRGPRRSPAGVTYPPTRHFGRPF
jgi:hypothetical protein